MVDAIAGALAAFGPGVVFLLVFLESVGLPLPGETVLLASAALAASGRLSALIVVIAASSGAFGGGLLGYWLGRRGRTYLMGPVSRSRMARRNAARARAFFRRYGVKAVFFGRFVAFLRSFLGITAGAAGMRPVPFAVYSGAGAVLWATSLTWLGYTFGRNLPRLERALGAAGLALAAALALAVILALALGWVAANGARLWKAAEGRWERSIEPRFRKIARQHPRAVRLVARRFTPGRYLGLHLTVGIAASTAALWLFTAILEDILTGEPLTRFDMALAAYFRRGATPAGLSFWHAVSLAGGTTALMAVGCAVAAVLLARRRFWLMAGWVSALVGALVLDITLKVLVRRPRPGLVGVHGLGTVHGLASWSFPSGHAMVSLVAYGMLAYLSILAARRSWPSWLAVGVAAVVVLAIGFSRLYIGVHYFSDVVGGYAAGAVWLSVCISGLEVGRRGSERGGVT
jgi:membrane protein DedA with SNARE-associated domain/membrane-associated phospholipid phosphatase